MDPEQSPQGEEWMGAVKDVAEQEVPSSHSCQGGVGVQSCLEYVQPWCPWWSLGMGSSVAGGPRSWELVQPACEAIGCPGARAPSYSGISLGLEPTSLGLESTSLGLESTSLGPKSLLCCSKRL